MTIKTASGVDNFIEVRLWRLGQSTLRPFQDTTVVLTAYMIKGEKTLYNVIENEILSTSSRPRLDGKRLHQSNAKRILIPTIKEIINSSLEQGHCDVAWHGCGKVNSDVRESLQHRGAKIILPNPGLDTKELNAALDQVPLINRWKLQIVLLVRKCLDGSVPPYLNNYFNLNTSVYSFTTRPCKDNYFLKFNTEVAKTYSILQA